MSRRTGHRTPRSPIRSTLSTRSLTRTARSTAGTTPPDTPPWMLYATLWMRRASPTHSRIRMSTCTSGTRPSAIGPPVRGRATDTTWGTITPSGTTTRRTVGSRATPSAWIPTPSTSYPMRSTSISTAPSPRRTGSTIRRPGETPRITTWSTTVSPEATPMRRWPSWSGTRTAMGTGIRPITESP